MQEEKSGKMVATEQGSYYYHADHLGSSSVVTDKDGKFYEQIEYFPYGETWINNKANSEQTSSPYKFTAKEQDEETGLYYYGARYYDAKLSRWCSADDRFDDLHSSQGMDVFAYVHGRPVLLNDPDGHAPKSSAVIDEGGGCKTEYYKTKNNTVTIAQGEGGETYYIPEKSNGYNIYFLWAFSEKDTSKAEFKAEYNTMIQKAKETAAMGFTVVVDVQVTVEDFKKDIGYYNTVGIYYSGHGDSNGNIYVYNPEKDHFTYSDIENVSRNLLFLDFEVCYTGRKIDEWNVTIPDAALVRGSKNKMTPSGAIEFLKSTEEKNSLKGFIDHVVKTKKIKLP